MSEIPMPYESILKAQITQSHLSDGVRTSIQPRDEKGTYNIFDVKRMDSRAVVMCTELVQACWGQAHFEEPEHWILTYLVLQ
jgi:hypothetical protein